MTISNDFFRKKQESLFRLRRTYKFSDISLINDSIVSDLTFHRFYLSQNSSSQLILID